MCMGSTHFGTGLKCISQNHPHEYGEYTDGGDFAKVTQESPPCVWGVRKNVCVTLLRVRMTPMSMGSTQESARFARRIAGITPMCMGSTPRLYICIRRR